jgi:lipid-binding SYLF domain-containing protein
MFRFLVLIGFVLLAFTAPRAARAQTDQQALVDRATLTIQDMFTAPNANNPLGTLRQSKGVLVCPRVFKAGFIIGGSGGGCVLLARIQGGGWSYPAFYTMGTGSFGLQAGVQDAQVVLMIMTQRGLQAVMDSQFKIGADASIAIATLGAGVEGATTAALRADIVAFSKTRGLFAGVSLAGSIISSDSGDNRAYYGTPLAPQQIVLEGQGQNPGAAPLREMLARFAG